MQTFFVEIELSNVFTEEFISRIPLQRKIVDDLMSQGKILSYSLAADRSRLWIVFEESSFANVMNHLNKFPLKSFMKEQIVPLAFHQASNNGFPHLSLN